MCKENFLQSENLIRFLKGEVDTQEEMLFKTHCEAYHFLLELQKQNTANISAANTFLFEDVERIIEKWFAGSSTVSELAGLKQAVLTTPKTLKHLQVLLEAHAQSMEQIPPNVLNNIPVKESRLKLIFTNRYVQAAVAMVAVLLVVLLLPLQYEKNIAEHYNFDNKVPADFNISLMRGNGDGVDSSDQAQAKFRNQFHKGMADYLVNNYSVAVEVWKKIEPEFKSLQKGEILSLKEQQNYNFYYGVSNLALYLSTKPGLNDVQKQEKLDRALLLFKHIPQKKDVHLYFNALAFASKKMYTKSKKMLNKIDDSSMYKLKRDTLIRYIDSNE